MRRSAPRFENKTLLSGRRERRRDRKPVPILRWMFVFALIGLFAVGVQNAYPLFAVGIQNTYPALTQSELFSLKQISVEGNWLLTRKEVVQQSGLRTGGNLFETDLSAAAKALASHPMIREALLMRRPPVGLEIWIAERRPLGLISTPEGLLGIDEEAVTFPLPQVPLDLPTITGVTASPKAEQTQVLKRLAAFLKEIEAAEPAFLDEISEIHVDAPSEARVFTVGDGLELRMRLEDADAQVRNLTAYLNAERISSKHPEYVDLRFRNQVVVRNR